MTRQGPVEAAEAMALLQDGIQRSPERPELWEELVALLLELKRPAKARDLAMSCLGRFPVRARLWTLLGRALVLRAAHSEAVEAFVHAEGLSPDNPFIPAALGEALGVLGDAEASAAAFGRAILLAPGRPVLHVRQAHQLLRLKDLSGAAAGFRSALARGASVEGLACISLIPLRNIADWRDHDRLRTVAHAQVLKAMEAGQRSPLPPGQFLALFEDSATHKVVARSWCPPVTGPRPVAKAILAGRPLRVGYLSADYRNHAMGHLMGGVMCAHDPKRVAVVALSLAPRDDDDVVQRRMRAGVPEWIELSGLTVAEVVEAVRAVDLDVLVDLMGHTQGDAMLACAEGLAPVQITWLGYPGTTGGDCFDHVVVDGDTGRDAAWFSERRIVMPHSYQPPNPSWRGGKLPSRGELGLPEDALIIGSFSQCYKIGPALFDAWMGLLRDHPRAVLWQIARPDASRQNLLRAVAGAGVDPKRLIFAGYVDHAAHLARLAHVDLGLDSRTWGAHTTARELLWAGVPFVTVAGDQMASRVGTGLLRASGLDELIAEDLPGYLHIASELLRDAPRRLALRSRIQALREGHPLFSLPVFMADWETALVGVAKAAAEGRPPADVWVVSGDPLLHREAPC